MSLAADRVVIGMDPHKRWVTIEVMAADETVLDGGRFGVVYSRMLADQKRREATGPAGHSGTTLQPSVTDLTPDIGSSDKPLPGPAKTQPKTVVTAAS